MAIVSLPGQMMVPIGAGQLFTQGLPGTSSTLLDAANEAIIMIGQIVTADGESHTIDTTGSSSIGWRTAAVTFLDSGTTLKVGIAAVDTGAGPSGRAVNAADVITFDVNAAFTGGGGGVTANAWQTSVPTAGTETIANGDFVAICVQMTARGATDLVNVVTANTSTTFHRPTVTTFLSAVYAAAFLAPNALITFSDGVLGYFHGVELFSSENVRTWNSGSSPSEYGQLTVYPFGMSICGIWGWVGPSIAAANFDVVLYSNPLGTPVAERTVSFDANTDAANAGRQFRALFTSPYTAALNQPIVAAFKPGATNIAAYYKTLASATHRITDPWGATGYGVQRAGGAFSDSNSSLDHYYIGLLIGGLEPGSAAAVTPPVGQILMW